MILLNLLQEPVQQAGIFSHITGQEIVAAIFGIIFVWALKYSKEKDKFDDEGKPFSFKQYWLFWFKTKNDNIFIHILFTFIAIWLGVDNLQAWLGNTLTIPKGVDEIGAALIIGFSGTYVVEVLKKAV
tara:strand:+ start:5815 stop:6198 length:384 start_codon:yes stop_codon:yes gene_type:complete